MGRLASFRSRETRSVPSAGLAARALSNVCSRSGSVTGEKKTAGKQRWVLDTSAILALRSDEPGADRVADVLHKARNRDGSVLLSFMTRMEVLYCVSRDEGEDAARQAIRLLDAATVRWVSCEPGILEEAARMKAHGGLSVADAWIAATAQTHQAILVHKDPEFASLSELQQEDLRV
jgi:predicted nucleic acid-binding protein